MTMMMTWDERVEQDEDLGDDEGVGSAGRKRRACRRMAKAWQRLAEKLHLAAAFNLGMLMLCLWVIVKLIEAQDRRASSR